MLVSKEISSLRSYQNGQWTMMSMQGCYVVLMLVVVCLPPTNSYAFSETYPLRSVKEDFFCAKNDANDFWRLTEEVFDRYIQLDYDSSLHYAQLGYRYSIKNDPSKKGHANILIGEAHKMLYNMDSAAYYLNLGTQQAMAYNDLWAIARAKRNWATMHYYNGDFQEAYDTFYELIEIYNSLHKIAPYKNLKLETVYAYNSLCLILSNWGCEEEFLSLLENGLEICDDYGFLKVKHFFNAQRIEYFKSKGLYEEAIELISSSKKLNAHEEYGPAVTLYYYRALADIYNSTGQYEKAFEQLQLAYSLTKSSGVEKKNLELVLDRLVYSAEKMGNYRYALEKHKELKLLSDTINSDRFRSEIEITTQNGQIEEQKSKILNQELSVIQAKQERNAIIGTSIITLISILLAYLFYSQRQKRRQQEAERALQFEKERADNLKELDQLKRQFFTNISHELRTPLTLITAPLKNVLDRPMTDEAREDISLAHRNSQKLLDMVNEIMDLSKLESGQVKVSEEDVLLVPTLRRYLFSFESLANIRDIQLQLESDVSNDVSLRVDPDHLEKIINNLVSNALKFSPNGGEVTLSVGVNGDDITIAVADQGAGIKEEDRERIFDRFYQSDQGISMQGGAGIGLALSRSLAHLMNGDIIVDSELGRGSKFTLLLPNDTKTNRGADDAGTIPTGEKRIDYAPLTINGQRPRVLVVEDNEDMSSYLLKILGKDYQCTAAINGVVGLQKIQKERFDLIISDVMMPGMDGFSLRETVLKIEGMDTVPYVFLTARSLDEDILKGLRLGVDDYITKPFQSEELLARVHNLIHRRIERQTFSDETLLHESEDMRTIKRAEQLVFEHIQTTTYTVADLAEDMAMSQKKLSRIIKASTGMTSVAFILELKLQKARQLIEKQIYNSLTDVRHEVGIDSASYFSRKYKERFGVSPSTLL